MHSVYLAPREAPQPREIRPQSHKVGFIPGADTIEEAINALFIVNRMVDCLFAVDIVLQFFLMSAGLRAPQCSGRTTCQGSGARPQLTRDRA